MASYRLSYGTSWGCYAVGLGHGFSRCSVLINHCPVLVSLREKPQTQETEIGSAPLTSCLVPYLERLCFLFLQLQFLLKILVLEVNGGGRNVYANLIRASLNLKLCLSHDVLRLRGWVTLLYSRN